MTSVYMMNDKYNLGSYYSSLSIRAHLRQRTLWDASLNISYHRRMVIHKEGHITELVKILQIRYTTNSYCLLLSWKNYVLQIVSSFLLILRKDLFSIEHLFSTVTKDPRVIFVSHLTLIKNSDPKIIRCDMFIFYPLTSKHGDLKCTIV